jgi:HK97 family phage portal protein
MLSQILGGPSSTAGVRVDSTSAQSLSTVWACVALLSSTIASLPLFVYRRRPDGTRERWPDHPVADLLTHSPNQWQNAFAFREAMMRCLLLFGNAFASISRDNAGRPRALALIPPTSVQIVADGNGVSYRITHADGSQTLEDDYDVMHVVGHSFDGVHGLSVIDAARRSLGLGIALEEFGASFFGRGSTFGGVLSPKANLTDPARETLRASLEKRHQGVDRAHQLLILPADMSFTPMTAPAEQAQFVESTKVSTATVARWFGVPPSLVNAESGAGSMRYSNAEAEAIAFLTYSLTPWLRRLETAYNRSLISSLERHQQYTEHLVDGLLRADAATRWNTYEKAISLGVMTPDEVRERENLGPRPQESA